MSSKTYLYTSVLLTNKLVAKVAKTMIYLWVVPAKKVSKYVTRTFEELAPAGRQTDNALWGGPAVAKACRVKMFFSCT